MGHTSHRCACHLPCLPIHPIHVQSGDGVALGGDSALAMAGEEALVDIEGMGADETGAPLAPPPPPDPPPPPISAAERYGLEGPSDKGYWRKDGRNILRIVRGQPKRSISVACYRHTSCTWVLPLRQAPSDDAIIDWLFSVEVPDYMAPRGAWDSSKDQHVELAKQFRKSG